MSSTGINTDEPMDTLSTEHIEKQPEKCGGQACIAGHRVRVADVVAWHEQRGYCPDEIVELFPGITIADVHAALTYYFDHREEIEDNLEKMIGLADALKAELPSKIPVNLQTPSRD
jgi:uncharacterized protein (DUF433 family)